MYFARENTITKCTEIAMPPSGTVQDGSSEPVAHVWSKIGIFPEKKSDLTRLSM